MSGRIQLTDTLYSSIMAKYFVSGPTAVFLHCFGGGTEHRKSYSATPPRPMSSQAQTRQIGFKTVVGGRGSQGDIPDAVMARQGRRREEVAKTQV